MTTIKGIYENGQVKLLESSPKKMKQKVLIVFMEDYEDDETARLISLSNNTNDFQAYLENSDEDLYQDYFKK
jgi:hypothetical protein